MSAYEDRVREWIHTFLDESNSLTFSAKHIFLTQAQHSHTVNETILNKHISHIHKRKHKSDFILITLIRFLYFKSSKLEFYQTQIDDVLKDFPFWPGHPDPRYDSLKHVIFWSENHIFMYLSSAVLYYQRAKEKNRSCLVGEKEERLLMGYLQAHHTFEGFYEVLSHTYLPYTFSALLNLYDFSTNETIVYYAGNLLEKLVTQILLGTNASGVCTYTASARQYMHTRLRCWGHNVNQLVRLITGVSPDEDKPSAVTDFLLTSKWVPSSTCVEAFHFAGFHRQNMNHSTADIHRIYESIEAEERVPFIWSAGLITHPDYIGDTKAYQERYDLSRNPGIKMLGYLPTSIAKGTMKYYDHYSAGQNYSGITLNVYRTPSRDVLITSFELYNVGLQSYQQNPWMINLDGIPLWAQSGGGLGANCLNSYCPAVSQNGNILVCAYVM